MTIENPDTTVPDTGITEEDLLIEIDESGEQEDTAPPSTAENPDTPSTPSTPSTPAATDNGEDDDLEDGLLSEQDRTVLKAKTQKRIQTLARKARQKEQELAAATARAAELEQKLSQLSVRAEESETRNVTEVENRLNVELESAKSAYKAAREEGNLEAEMEATEKLAEVKARLLAVGSYKKQLESRKPAQPAAETPAGKPAAAQPQVQDKRLASWLKDNTWFTSDPVMHSAALAINQQVLAEGYKPGDSDDDDFGQEAYYAEIDKRIRESFPHKFQSAAPAKSPATPKTPVGAPRTPANASASAKAKRTVKLTSRQVAFCKANGIKLEDFAREQLRLNGGQGE